MVQTDLLLGGVLVFLTIVLILLVQVRREIRRTDTGVDTDQLTAALSRTLSDMDFAENVTRIADRAAEMQMLHRDLEGMLRAPRERGEFGEVQLEVMLSDHLPPDMYGIRERVVDNKTPDAHIETAEGIVPIDSKFSLDRYEASLDAEDPDETATHRRAFHDAVAAQLEKIEGDYVRPEAGTTDFAFAYIPSESVYYHLITEEYDLLREYTKRGVQVVSPLTLGHKLELLKAGVHAQQLSEEAQEILDRLETLGSRFDEVESEWSTLQTHLSNASNKADDVDRELARVRNAFDRIEGPTIGDGSDPPG